MQPEVKQKIEKPKKELTPDQQWDMLAFKVIESNLAPKGFKKVNNGKFRNLEIVNSDLPGLPKSKVQVCQRQAAQLVRGFRDKVKKDIERYININNAAAEKALQELITVPFYRFKKRRLIKETIMSFKQNNEGLTLASNELDNVNIK